MSRLASMLLALALLVGACSVSDGPADDEAVASTTSTTSTTVPSTTSTGAPAVVRVGAEVLADGGFAELDGARVGLIANQTTLVDGRHLIDVLHEADNVELVAVFAPEHGVRGTAGAGELIDDEVDTVTGVPILSLYGETRRPTIEMLEGIDTIVYDLQDVGGRFYTYISTMGLAMQTANEVGARFVVLDRPDPSGLTTPAGFVLEPEHVSFIGQYPIPAAYAMTAGEVARAIVGEGWLDGVAGLDLEVVEMAGWQRGMTWAETGRKWVPPSPGLQTARSAVVYLGTVLFEATSISYGGGTDLAFELVGAPWADADLMALELNARGLAGVRFDAITFAPRPIPGRTSNPRLNGEVVHGVQIVIEDRATFDPVATAVHVLDAFWREARVRGVADDEYLARPAAFTLLAGTTRLVDELLAGATASEVVEGWAAELDAFTEVRSAYLLY
ncbi:MAG: DUF1343 domain-containing protein [Actinomycetota bacterium]